MKSSIRLFSLLVASFLGAVLPAYAQQVNVTQEHNNVSRDGVYIDAGFTPSAAANLTRDLNFNGTISGNVYAQPLYIEGGPNGPMVIAVTESNNVYALDATTGLPIWSRTDIGPPVPTTPCGGFNPTGITGTPVVDLASRRLFFDALINGSPTKHFIYSLNVDTGVTTPGWPVDLNATVIYNGIPFVSLAQEQRGGLALVNGIVYSSYSGYVGDCGNYHGWVVGVDINNPTNVQGWATTAIGGGIWGHGKVKRLFGTGAGLIFKGSGFYTTDYRSQSYKEAAKKESAPKAAEGGEKSAASKEPGKSPSPAQSKIPDKGSAKQSGE